MKLTKKMCEYLFVSKTMMSKCLLATKAKMIEQFLAQTKTTNKQLLASKTKMRERDFLSKMMIENASFVSNLRDKGDLQSKKIMKRTKLE